MGRLTNFPHRDTKCLYAKVGTTLWKFIYLGSNAWTRKHNCVSRESTQEMNLASQKITMVILLKSKSIEQSLVCPFTLTLWPKQNKKKLEFQYVVTIIDSSLKGKIRWYVPQEWTFALFLLTQWLGFFQIRTARRKTVPIFLQFFRIFWLMV